MPDKAIRRNFTVYGNPLPKARPRTVYVPGRQRPVTFTPRQTQAWEKQVVAAALEGLDGSMPLSGRVAVELHFHRANRLICDLDNLAKSVLDALNSIAYHDDSQVAELHLYRHHDPDRPRVEITIWRLLCRE